MVGEGVPKTLTLKNIPDEIYERLKASAVAHHRSLNGEAIVCLERALLPRRIGAEERLERIQHLQAGLKTKQFDHDLVDVFKREGRP
jgi:plasmid stability protein